LARLDTLIGNHYDDIWDGCCDHGQLGLALLGRQINAVVHFVDIVPEIIDTLYGTLIEHFAVSDDVSQTWQTHCLDLAKIPLASTQGKQLVVIAGVGGELTRQLVTAIHNAQPDRDIDFLLCPIRQHYRLRSHLRSQNFYIKHESLVEENGRIYEVILTRHAPGAPEDLERISAVGRDIWHARDRAARDTAQRYLDQVLQHYSRMARSNNSEALMIRDAYRLVALH